MDLHIYAYKIPEPGASLGEGGYEGGGVTNHIRNATPFKK